MLKKSTKNLTKIWRFLFRFDDFLGSYLLKFRFFDFWQKSKIFQVLFQYFRCFIRKNSLFAKNTQKEPKSPNICSKLVNFSLLLSLRPRASNSKNFVSKKTKKSKQRKKWQKFSSKSNISLVNPPIWRENQFLCQIITKQNLRPDLMILDAGLTEPNTPNHNNKATPT